MKELKQQINTQNTQITVKYRRLDHDIYRSFTKFANFEIFYLVIVGKG